MTGRDGCVVFVGPSLPRADVTAALGDARIEPPAARGDIERCVADGARELLLIDGAFGHRLAVAPSEIVDALAGGARILGASSLGAIRAAECHPAGMGGVGAVYHWYRLGVLRDDDEVAVATDPDREHAAVSVALVHVRYLLLGGLRCGALSRDAARRLLDVARATHFARRSWSGVFGDAGVPLSAALQGLIAPSDVKRVDAAIAVARLAAGPLPVGPLPAPERRSPGRGVAPHRARGGSAEARYRGHDPLLGRPVAEWRRLIGAEAWARAEAGGALERVVMARYAAELVGPDSPELDWTRTLPEPMDDRRPSALPGEGGRGPGSLPGGEVTFLFTDIEGSTPLLRVLGDRYAELLGAHNQVVADAVLRFGGSVVRTEGDAFFVAFADAAAAVAAALAAQRGLTDHPWPADAVLRVRMGLHTGEGTPSDGDYISLAVHQAARVSDAAHGGQILISETTRALVGERLPPDASLTSLGPHRLRGFTVPTTLYQLCHPSLPSGFGALRALPASAHNVPAPATLFVGRQTALAELANLVRNRRLTTVLGPGGVGKTRLVVELVPLVADQFADGVWLIELDRIGRGAAIAPEVAGALGIRTGLDEVGSVIDGVGSKQMLLVLDNCEHVIDSAAALAEALVARCPEVNLLCTSREPLALAMEQRFPLSPLSVPDGRDPAGLVESEAVALFVDRARAVVPGFDLRGEAPAVAEICRRLDGLPLAIELAAARAGSIPVASLAARLDRRFSVLRRGHRGAPGHHETLSASIAWSVDLLEPDEQILFRRLGAFRGEFELDAVEAVCALAPLEPDDVLDLLSRLVEKSLVQSVDRRYVLLDSIRDYARELIQAEDEREALGRSHLAHYVEVAEACADIADGPEQRAAYDRLDAALANLRSAVEFAVERSDPAALRLAAVLVQYGFVRNHLGEVAQWALDAAVAARDAPVELRVRALSQAGFALIVQGAVAEGHQRLDEGVALARELADDALLVDTLVMAADMRLESGLVAEARELCAEVLASAERLGDDRSLGRATYVEAIAGREQLGYAETHRRLGQALTRFLRAGDRRQVARVSLAMAFLSLAAGELAAAGVEAERCVEVADAMDHPIGRAMARSVQMWIAIERGDAGRASELLAEVALVARQSGYVALLGAAAAAAAVLDHGAGRLERAAVFIGALDASPGALGAEDLRAINQRVEQLRGALAESLGSDRFAELAARGAAVSLSELI